MTKTLGIQTAQANKLSDGMRQEYLCTYFEGDCENKSVGVDLVFF